MKRLLYISTARKPLSQSDLQNMLARARQVNATANVTGLLVVGGRRFLQVLEGPHDAVDKIFERIENDDRHFALVKLHDIEIVDRSFGAWNMRFEYGADCSRSTPLEEQVLEIITPITDANLRAYFAGFAKTHSSV